VVEKPFGEDLESARKLNALVQSKFKDDEVYRIDHFMGKEILQNILPLRFSNTLYSQMWDKDHVQSIVVNVKESLGLEGRAGYFDESGIIRDMVQNHLLSIVALLTMEEPESRNDQALHKAKTNVSTRYTTTPLHHTQARERRKGVLGRRPLC
jgi:glucose-6-phosphate 1-dehydrogenase